jgi:arylsulfatase A-like enzyme
MLPTLAKIASAPLPEPAANDGEDISPALLGQPFTRTKPLFWEYGRNPKSFAYPNPPDHSPNLAMRDGPWKFLSNADATGAELYDILADPDETKNLAGAQPGIVAKMQATLLEWRRSLPALTTPN